MPVKASRPRGNSIRALLGIPPKEVGPRAGATLDEKEIHKEYYEAMGWDVYTGKPSKASPAQPRVNERSQSTLAVKLAVSY